MKQKKNSLLTIFFCDFRRRQHSSVTYKATLSLSHLNEWLLTHTNTLQPPLIPKRCWIVKKKPLKKNLICIQYCGKQFSFLFVYENRKLVDEKYKFDWKNIYVFFFSQNFLKLSTHTHTPKKKHCVETTKPNEFNFYFHWANNFIIEIDIKWTAYLCVADTLVGEGNVARVGGLGIRWCDQCSM